MRRHFITISLLFTCAFMHAQPARIVFDHFGASEGFNSQEAMCTVTGRDGLLWISSNDGLVRYDSKTFRFYKHHSADSTSLSNNYCKLLQTDKRGWIWVQSDDDLDVFDPAKEKFSHIKLRNEKGEPISVNPLAFNYDETGDIMWIGTSKGLYFSKQGSLRLTSASTITTSKEIINNTIITITADSDHWLWVTSGNTICKLNTVTGAVEKTMIPEKIDGFINPSENFAIFSACLDKHKTLWLGSWQKGLIEFNTLTGKFHQYCYLDYTKQENTITSIIQTPQKGQENILWLSTTGFGFSAFNIDTKKFRSYNTSSFNDRMGIKGTAYFACLNGNAMWIGSQTGLHLYDFSRQLFSTINLDINNANNSDVVISDMAIERDEQGKDQKLWLYIPYKNAYIYDLKLNKTLPVPAKVQQYVKPSTNFFCWYISSNNILWVSTNEYGLIGYDIKQDRIILPEKTCFYKTWEWVGVFFEDNSGQLWLGTYNGIFLMDKKTNLPLPVNDVNRVLTEKKLSKAILSIAEDENRNIWFTADFTDKKTACVGRYNSQSKITDIIYNEASLARNYNPPVELTEIVCNKKGQVFFSLKGEDILWVNSNTASPAVLHTLKEELGLNNNRVETMLTDSTGDLWCANRSGISCYKSQQNLFINYPVSGYDFEMALVPAIRFSSDKSRMYIGQSGTLKYFNIHAEQAGKAEAPLLFMSVKIADSISLKGIKNGSVLNLSHDQNMLSVEFALLSYANSSENTYSWKLEGLEKEWNISKNNIAAYRYLSPGKYTLLVKAANSQGEWTASPISLTIIISPPFYKTWWFILLSFLSAAGIVYYFFQLRIKRIKARYQLRNKIASDLHDEIGSTITSINILSNVSQQAMEQQPLQAKEMMQQISAQSKLIQQNMSDIVWSIRPDNEKVENLLVRMREYAAQTLEPLNIILHMETDHHLLNKVLPMECRKEILLIYKEAINNITKHAEASAVWISFSNGYQQLKLTIRDNGQWKGNSSGTGTRSMKERAAAIGGSLTVSGTPEGTTVEAIIPIT